MSVNALATPTPLINCIEFQNLFDWTDAKSDLSKSSATNSIQTTLFCDFSHGDMYGGTGDGRFFDSTQKSTGYSLSGNMNVYNNNADILWYPIRRPYIQSNNFFVRINVNSTVTHCKNNVLTCSTWTY